MKLIGIEDLRVNMGKVFDEVAQGEWFIVTRAETPIGVIKPFNPVKRNLETLRLLRKRRNAEREQHRSPTA